MMRRQKMTGTKQLTRQVKYCLDRYSWDFIFTIVVKEYQNLRYQIGYSS